MENAECVAQFKGGNVSMLQELVRRAGFITGFAQESTGDGFGFFDVRFRCEKCKVQFKPQDLCSMETHHVGDTCVNQIRHKQAMKLEAEKHMTKLREKTKRQKDKKQEYMKEYNMNRKSVSSCTTCQVEFRSKKEEERHMNGKQHKYKLNPPNYDCQLCGSHFLSEKQLQTHKETAKHKKMEAENQTIV